MSKQTRRVSELLDRIYWEPKEWEVLIKKIVLTSPFSDKNFYNVLSEGIKGIKQIIITRDDDYKLYAIGKGDFIPQKEQKNLEEGTILPKSILYADWEYFYRAKVIDCYMRTHTIHYNLSQESQTFSCQFDIRKVKFHEKKKSGETVCLIEWYLNAPSDISIFTETTQRTTCAKAKKYRENSREKYRISKNENFRRDSVFIQYEDTGFYICKVPEEFAPLWAHKLSIEYRQEFGRIPSKKERIAIRELVGFLLGRELLYIGKTEYADCMHIRKAMIQNPMGINVRKICGMSNIEIVPIYHIDAEKGFASFKLCLESILPVYLKSRMRKAIHNSLPLYWTSSLLPIETAFPVISSAIEMVQKSWFSLEENKGGSSYYQKGEFRQRIKSAREALKESFSGTQYEDVMLNKINQLNQMTVRDKNKVFMEELKLPFGEKESIAMKARNCFAHGDSDERGVDIISSLNVLQILYAKILLKLLHYNGEYIDRSEHGYPRKKL